jgi:hypothetical protein
LADTAGWINWSIFTSSAVVAIEICVLCAVVYNWLCLSLEVGILTLDIVAWMILLIGIAGFDY